MGTIEICAAHSVDGHSTSEQGCFLLSSTEALQSRFEDLKEGRGVHGAIDHVRGAGACAERPTYQPKSRHVEHEERDRVDSTAVNGVRVRRPDLLCKFVGLEKGGSPSNVEANLLRRSEQREE